MRFVHYTEHIMVYFPLEKDFPSFRSICIHTHLQYCCVNWVPGHNIISMHWKSVLTTVQHSRVGEHLAASQCAGVEQIALCCAMCCDTAHQPHRRNLTSLSVNHSSRRARWMATKQSLLNPTHKSRDRLTSHQSPFWEGEWTAVCFIHHSL